MGRVAGGVQTSVGVVRFVDATRNRRFFRHWSKQGLLRTVVKHLFCDTAAKAMCSNPWKASKLYEKPCRHALRYGNLFLMVIRLC